MPRMPPARRGLYPSRAASARNCSPETPSDRAEVSGRVGLSRASEARGLRSPHGRRVLGALGDERRLTTPALHRPSENFQLGRATRVRPSGRAEPPIKKTCTVSVRGARLRHLAGAIARRAPCRKGLCSGSLDRHAQYNGAPAEKASEDGVGVEGQALASPDETSVDEAAQAYADGEADGDRGREDGGEARAHQRERHAYDGQHAERHPGVDEYLEGEPADDCHDDEHPRAVGRAPSPVYEFCQEHGVGQQQEYAACEARVLGDDREDEVRLRLGQELELALRCRALRLRAPQAALPDGEYRLPRVVAVAAAVCVLRVEYDLDALLLVGLYLAGLHAHVPRGGHEHDAQGERRDDHPHAYGREEEYDGEQREVCERLTG